MKTLKRFAILSAIAAIGLVFSASPARATFTLFLSQDGNGTAFHTFGVAGGTFTGSASGTFIDTLVGGVEGIQFSGNVGNYTVQFNSESSNSAANTLPAFLTSQSTSDTIVGSGMQTLTVDLTDTGFKVPGAGPAAMTTGFSTTSIVDANDMGTDQSFLSGSPGTKLTLTANAALTHTDLESIPTTPYTLENEMVITAFAGDTALVFQGSTDVSPIPAPTGLLLVLTGAPVLAMGYCLRRRLKLQPQAA